MTTNQWIVLLIAAGAAAAVAKAAGGPDKRPSADGQPVSLNGNGPLPDVSEYTKAPTYYC